ncbi:MAG: response regulator [Candidatus Rokuibacteriota bacterium]
MRNLVEMQGGDGRGRERRPRQGEPVPDVVLLDVGLPGMSGYDVARRLRQDARRSGLTIIALSGYGQEEHRTESRQAGCDAHLVKPVDPDVLRRILAATT